MSAKPTNPITSTTPALDDSVWGVKLGSDLKPEQATEAFNAIVATLDEKAKPVVEREHATFTEHSREVLAATAAAAQAMVELRTKTISFREAVQKTYVALVREGGLDAHKAGKLVKLWGIAYGFQGNSVNKAIAELLKQQGNDDLVRRAKRLSAPKGKDAPLLLKANDFFDRQVENPLKSGGFSFADLAAGKAIPTSSKGDPNKETKEPSKMTPEKLTEVLKALDVDTIVAALVASGKRGKVAKALAAAV